MRILLVTAASLMLVAPVMAFSPVPAVKSGEHSSPAPWLQKTTCEAKSNKGSICRQWCRDNRGTSQERIDACISRNCSTCGPG